MVASPPNASNFEDPVNGYHRSSHSLWHTRTAIGVCRCESLPKSGVTSEVNLFCGVDTKCRCSIDIGLFTTSFQCCAESPARRRSSRGPPAVLHFCAIVLPREIPLAEATLADKWIYTTSPHQGRTPWKGNHRFRPAVGPQLEGTPGTAGASVRVPSATAPCNPAPHRLTSDTTHKLHP